MKKNLSPVLFFSLLVAIVGIPYFVAAQQMGGQIPGNAATGVINSGTTGEITYYGASGTTVSGSTVLFQSTTGNIGIGTTAPGAKLDVYGSAGIGTIDLGGVNGISYLSSDSTAGATIAIGPSALATQNSAGSAAWHNVAIGYQAMGLGTMTTASVNNVAIGYQSFSGDTVGNNNVYIGYNSASISTGSSNSVGIGASANAGSNGAVVIGASAAGSSGGVSIGYEAGSAHGPSANFGTLIGYQAGRYLSATATGSTALGYQAMLSATNSGVTGIGNTAIGWNALTGIINAAANNTALGYGAGSTLTTGTNNVIIGPNVASTTLTTGSNNILIGTTSAIDATTTATSNTIVIGGSGGAWITVNGTGTQSTQAAIIYGTVTESNWPSSSTGDYICSNAGLLGLGTSVCSLSSIRWKNNVVSMDDGALQKILAMRPVRFRYKPQYGDHGKFPHDGFIAEEAIKVIPDMVTIGEDGQPSGFNYPEYTSFLTKGMQEQHTYTSLLAKIVQEQQKEIEAINPAVVHAMHKNAFGRFMDYLEGVE